jgi:hypothetical protein
MKTRLWMPAVAALLVGCDKEPSKLDQIVEAAAAPPPQPPPLAPPLPPAAPAAPAISVDDTACTINGEEVLFMAPDAPARILALVSSKPLVEGQVVTFDATREAKTPRVEAVVAVIKKAKAKGARIHTSMRDGSMGELLLTFVHGAVSECAPVAKVARDGSIEVWSAWGGTAQKFTHGFAGPDLTLGTQGLRKVSAACSSSVWLLGADDNIAWGLTFDLAMRARTDTEGGVAMRASDVVLLTRAPVAGRKVEVE